MQCAWPFADFLVLLADVLGAAVPVVVRVVRLVRDQPAQERAEVLEHAALVLVHAHAARRVRRVDAADAVDDARLADDLATSSVMSVTWRPPVVWKCRSAWKTFIGVECNERGSDAVIQSGWSERAGLYGFTGTA